MTIPHSTLGVLLVVGVTTTPAVGQNNYNEVVRFGARDYAPDSARWTAKDPIRFEAGDTSLFGYVNGNPINQIDPLGLFGYRGTMDLDFSPNPSRPSSYETCPPDSPCETSFEECMKNCVSFFNPLWTFYGSTGLGLTAVFGKGGVASGAATASGVWATYGSWVGILCPRACVTDKCGFDGIAEK